MTREEWKAFEELDDAAAEAGGYVQHSKGLSEEEERLLLESIRKNKASKKLEHA